MGDERERIGNIKQDDGAFYDVHSVFRMQQAISVQLQRVIGTSGPLTGVDCATVGVILTDWPALSIPTGSLARLGGFGYIPPLGGALSLPCLQRSQYDAT